MDGQQENAWDGIVGDLYDAVLQKKSPALQAAIARFERLIGSDGCHLFGMPPRGRSFSPSGPSLVTWMP